MHKIISNTNALDLGSQYFSYFDVKPKFDGMLSLLYHRPVLDIFAFDDFLHSKYGAYEEKEISMKELIKKEYGQKCLDFVCDACGLGV